MEENNQLWEEDIKLFDSLRNHYISINEKKFFETLEYKERQEPSFSWECLIKEDENEDNIYITRVDYDEYIVGCRTNNSEKEEHVMNLSEALSLNLNDLGVSDKDETLLEWLRHRDYQNISYNRNFDLYDGKSTIL